MMKYAYRETTIWLSAWRTMALLLAMLAVAAAERPVLVKADAQALSAVQPGGRAMIAVNLHIEPGWHLYWTNPGDSGLPPRLSWKLPVGWSAAAPRFPVPERVEESGLVSFIYRHDVRLLVEVSAPANATVGEHPLAVQVDYLACKESCMPGKTTATVLMPVVAQAAPSPAMDMSDFAQPLAASGATVAAQVRAGAIEIEVRGTSLPEPSAFPFIPADEGRFQLTAKQVVSASSTRWCLRVPLAAGQAQPDIVRGVLVGLPGVAGATIEVPLTTESPEKIVQKSVPTTNTSEVGTTLIGALAVGLIGGLLLNLMPCVLPVLALKVLAVNRARAAGQPLLGSALGYAAGVIAAYLVLAGVLLALRASGLQVGWGFQLQEPAVVLALTVLFVVLALNLAGVFEIGLATTRVDASRGGAVLNGVLTTVVATPCGAPFVSTALAFAAVAPVGQALAVFFALGVGLAAPVVLVAIIPGFARLLPKPGAWMEDLKHLLAIPMLGAAGWMAWTAVAQLGGEASFAVLVVGLPLVVLAAGAYGRFQHSGAKLALVVLVLAALGAIGVGGWAVAQPRATESHAASHGWEPWSEAREQALRASGTPFLIDFTAAWCLTCQVNKRTTLHDSSLSADLDARGVIRLRADFTASDPAIAAALARYGRASVPTYVLNCGAGVDGATRETILPDLLTPGIVRDAIAVIPKRSP